MSSDSTVIRVAGAGKCYEMYRKPSHRLWQSLSRGRAKFFDEFWALRDISFEVRKGECVGILGNNGSGKSTLLQLIAGTLTLTTGRIEVEGRIAALLELGSGFSPEFTGRENVFMNGAILGFSPREIEERFGQIAAFADIGDFIDRPVKTYSSGMMLRLAFAVQVQVEPDILIVDEALAVGDARFQLKCFTRLEELMARGTTILFVSHSIEQVKKLCTRGILLNNGKMVMQGDPVHCGLEYYRILFPKGTSDDDNGKSKSLSTSGETDNEDSDDIYRYHVDMSNAAVYGKGNAAITDISVEGLVEPNVFYGGEELTVRMRYELNFEQIHKIAVEEGVAPMLQFGIRIDTQQGVVLTDIATGATENHNGGIPLAHLEARETPLVLEYRIRIPELQQGEYFLSPGVALGYHGAMAPLVEYVHLFSLTCTPTSLVHGLMKCDCTIEESE